MDRIDFESSSAVERSERIREAERARGDKGRQQREKRKRRVRRRGKHEDAEAEHGGEGKKTGSNLDIEA
ncbi:MAG: hypothetical protein PVJ42_05710 [bacterium]|jgi:hypothetical protein